MSATVRIVDMPVDDALRWVAADWSIGEWGVHYPGDTIETYLDLYRQAAETAGLPVVLAAMAGEDIVGTASLVEDDELPGATEPGPWVAAVYVHPGHRRTGIGRHLVTEAVVRASRLGHTRVFLYTHDSERWYQSMGWHRLRSADLHGSPVTVMTRATAIG